VEVSTLILIFLSAFPYFSRGRENLAIIAILQTIAGLLACPLILGYDATALYNIN